MFHFGDLITDVSCEFQHLSQAKFLVLHAASEQLVVLALQSYDAAEGPALAQRYEKLNWRIISKPGGATVKPDDFYTLYG